MKTAIKNLLVTVLGVMVSTSAVLATPTNEPVNTNLVTVLKETKNITKIVATGNVEVYIIQAPVESISVFDTYYSKNAIVQQKEGVLRIISFENEPLKVTVYVRNLSAIEAGDNAVLKTYGKVNFLSLDVLLHNNAKADINVNTVNLFTTVEDNASLKLSGSTAEHFAMLGSDAEMTTGNFVADVSDIKSIPTKYIAKVNLLKPNLENLVIVDEFTK